MDFKLAIIKQLINISDVMLITGYKRSKAFVIMKRCRKDFNGSVPVAGNFITSDSLLFYFGINKSELIKQYKGGNRNEQK